jgi:hypothetical protein
MKQIAFGYPRRGLDGLFNTFRLGKGLASLTPGEEVELVDSRSLKVLKRATVVSVHTGPLSQMAPLHARDAHNWKEHPFQERPALLVASLSKRYPPGRVQEHSPVTVIYMRTQECPSSKPASTTTTFSASA